MIKPDPHLRQLLQDIDRSKARVWALTNAYRTVCPSSNLLYVWVTDAIPLARTKGLRHSWRRRSD